jgi:hypothetical protein
MKLWYPGSEIWVYFVILGLCTACSSGRTKYQSLKENEGYLDQTLDRNLRLASFKGNSSTDRETAELFAKFRAIEVCFEQKKAVTHILDIIDKTKTREVVRSSSWGPSYHYGLSPFYGRYHSSGFGIGVSSSSVDYWNETLTYPQVNIIYECAERVSQPLVFFREVRGKDMKHLIKDLKGGIQVEKILDNSPNKTRLEVGDILIKALGKRIQSVPELLDLFSDHNSVPVVLLREGEHKTIVLYSQDVTENVQKDQQEVIQTACDKKEFSQRALCKKEK